MEYSGNMFRRISFLLTIRLMYFVDTYCYLIIKQKQRVHEYGPPFASTAQLFRDENKLQLKIKFNKILAELPNNHAKNYLDQILVRDDLKKTDNLRESEKEKKDLHRSTRVKIASSSGGKCQT